MPFRRRAFSHALRVCLLALGALLAADSEPGQWVGDLYMVKVKFGRDPCEWVFLDEHDDVRRVIPNIEKTADFPGLCQTCGDISFWSRWHGDALHTVADGAKFNEGSKAYRNHVFARWQEGEWRFIGTCKTVRENLLHFVPCDGDRFIVISDETDLFDDRRSDRSPFCRMSVQEGRYELRLDASIDHGQGDLRKHMSEPGCFGLAWYSKIIVTEGRATLINQRTGLYWVFSTETAALMKAGSIFKDVTPEMMARGGFDSAILCANPEKSGTVLLSAQDEGPLVAEKEDAYREYHDLWHSYPEETRPEDEVDALFYRRLEEIRSRSPLIVWYRIHPENGRVERLSVPPEGGAAFRKGWDNEWWRPMADGSVKMGWHVGRLGKLKEQVPKVAAGADGGAKGGKGGVAPARNACGAVSAGETHPAAPGQTGGDPPDGGGAEGKNGGQAEQGAAH